MRLEAAKDRLIFLLQLAVPGKRIGLQAVADELDRPRPFLMQEVWAL